MYTMVLLDDEKIVLQGIQKVCEKEDCGFLVKGAFVDPLKALDALPELRPHLIITDVRMPQMDGLEFAKVQRKFCRRVRSLFCPDTGISRMHRRQ